MAHLKFALFGSNVETSLIASNVNAEHFRHFEMRLFDGNNSYENSIGYISVFDGTMEYCLEKAEKAIITAYHNYGIAFNSADFDLVNTKLFELFGLVR